MINYEQAYKETIVSIFEIAKAVYGEPNIKHIKKVAASALFQYLKDNFVDDNQFMNDFIGWLEEN